MERIIADILKELGISPNLKGYHYLKSAILKLVNEGKDDFRACPLYADIAKEYSTTSSRVERAIRHAIEISMDRSDLSLRYRLFKYAYSSNKGKPTNSEFISTLVEYIKFVHGGESK